MFHKIGILGGTGNEGSGLAVRFAAAGYNVAIGSRTYDRAKDSAQRLSTVAGKPITAADNRNVAMAAEIVILTVPFAAQLPTLESVKADLQGKILIDTTVPLVPPRVTQVQLPKRGSAAQMAQDLLGERVRVVSAFQNVSAHHLKDLSHNIETDVIVCGDDSSTCNVVIELARSIGARAFYGGALCNSAATEALTSVLITINRQYKVLTAGIKITGIPA
jgi:NADPH-dependent F420 reductase